MSTRIAVDIGGTFTDLVYFNDEDGSVFVTKVPTTPLHPEEGCMSAVEIGVPGDVIQAADYFLHGTTVGLNALLERRGACVGLLTTAGFRDVLEIRNGIRGEPYNIAWRPKPPLVSRDLRIGIRERCRHDGSVLSPLNEQDVIDALEDFQKKGVGSIAIQFLHSYVNPAHELKAASILREAGFEGYISMSHRVSGEYRDYERASTTVVDAFVRARMSSYLDHVDNALRQKGFSGTPLMMRSGTGSMTFSDARERPFETINSGPVGGVEGAVELSRKLGVPNLITADVGGTSFDAALIIDGRPRLLNQGLIDGMPLQTDWVDVRSIGAGGGSIAEVDFGGFMTVGPRSAGADPGPACYGRGGTLPTTTDAALYLGMLGDGLLASGLRLDRDAAGRALEPLAAKLGYSTERAAIGVIAIASSHMATLVRDLALEQGMDPRAFKLVPFGGAGPMLATQIARELNIDEIVVPPHAGNFSAWGLLGADLLRTQTRTKVMSLTEEAVRETNDLLSEMLPTLMRDKEELELVETITASLDMRYAGQEHTLGIIPDQVAGRIVSDAAEIETLFRRLYAQAYKEAPAGRIEIVNIRLSRRRTLPARQERYDYPTGSQSDGSEYYSFAEERRMLFAKVQRGTLEGDTRYRGPAIIYEPTTTTYVDADFSYGIDVHGCLILQRERKTA